MKSWLFVATAVSIVFSPFAYLTLYLIAVVAAGGTRMALPALVLWLGLGVLPALGILVGVRRGVWSDVELSRLSERRRLLPLACIAYAVMTWLTTLLHMPGPLHFAAVAFLVAALSATLITLFWKISLHTSCAGSVFALCLLQLGTGAAVTAAVIAVALGWSRLRLGRHDALQVVAGTALGLGVTLVLAALSPAGRGALSIR